MSLKAGRKAIDALTERLGPVWDGAAQARIEDGPTFGLDVLPDGFTAVGPDKWIWANAEKVPPLRDPAAYDLEGVTRLHESPYAVLKEGGRGWSPDVEAYCRSSVDVTMRGGTTSGVVYPLAICEIARRYRLRNVGGASAGAIAAAAAAAAEVGRMAAADGTLSADSGPLSPEDRQEGRVRAGFPGLADSMAWLAQVDDPGRQQYRVAQLFRPGERTRPLFRLMTAFMRKRPWAYPWLVLGAFGVFSKILTLLTVVGVFWAVMATRPEPAGFWADLGASAVGLVAFGAAVLGAILLLIRLIALSARLVRGRPAKRHEALREPLGEPAHRKNGELAWLALGLLVAGLGLIAATIWWPPLKLHLPTLALAWCALVLVTGGILGASVLSLLGQGRTVGFGVVPGSAPAAPGWNLWDRIAGTPVASQRALMPWLSDTLSELAGLPQGQVLRFGHLWFGLDFQPGQPRADLHATADDPRRRRVNLELMTSELVQRRAYHFPLRRGQRLDQEERGRLYFRKTDLSSKGREILPDDVVAAMTVGPVKKVRDLNAGTGEEFEVYELPEPWDLPVAFAVRLSLSLPGLFQAVRLYRLAETTTVRDEFGRVIARDQTPQEYPQPDGGFDWAQELWFTDGGVTSNFPIHFFDSPLPLWPTFGINLGEHPPGFAHQDVWLPQDWQARSSLAAPMSKSYVGFVWSIVDTARGWRDNTQTRMPGYRGRVAWVRQRDNEGGENLFMPDDVIAALALRGAFAGARLRRRFSSEPFWRRHQWLRQRTAMGNLEDLRDLLATSGQDPHYQCFAADGATSLSALIASLEAFDPEAPPGVPDPWFTPAAPPTYWAGFAAAIAAVGGLTASPSLVDGPPEPAPHLRQVPPA